MVSPAFSHILPVTPSFEKTELSSDSGYVTLKWPSQPSEGKDVEVVYHLIVASDETFSDSKLLYAGPYESYFISGLQEGVYFFKVRVDGGASGHNGPWSEPAKLTVQFPPTSKVVGYMVMGILVFLATVIAVWTGHRNSTSDGGTQ